MEKKEAMKILKDFRDKSALFSVRTALDTIIPELKEPKESEDEQSKNWILEYLYDGLRKSNEQFKEQFKAAIAWLEKQGEQKPEWSDEDEFELECILGHLKNYLHEDAYMGYKNWFKSLKDRVLPQPKQEWSEEDEQHIDSLLKRLKGLCGNVFERTRFAISEDRDWLKSLRPQNVWISVDEEVYVKEPVLAQKKDKSDPFKGYVVCCDHTLIPNVYERYMILGNIVSQNTSQPSDEHYELEEFAKIVRGNLTGISEAVQEQFEAKYLQLTGNEMYGGFKD